MYEEKESARFKEQSGMTTPAANNGVWKWISGSLLTVTMFLFGFVVGGYSSHSRLDSHIVLPGHPLIVERVSELRYYLERIEEEQKDQAVTLDEIYRSLPSGPGK